MFANFTTPAWSGWRSRTLDLFHGGDALWPGLGGPGLPAGVWGCPPFMSLSLRLSEQKAGLERLSPEAVKASDLAGEPIVEKLMRAPGNGAPIEGLKVVTRNGWFAARPSGTEAVYKIYAESFKDEQHLQAILADAQEIVSKA